MVVAKIVAYDSAAPADAMLLVADRNDDFDFERAIGQLRAFIPLDVPVEEIARGQATDAAARARLLAALNGSLRLNL